MVRLETTLFLRQDPHAPAVLAEAASDDLQQYLAGVRPQQDAPVLAVFCPILPFVEYHDDAVFPLNFHPPLQIKPTMISISLQHRAGSPLRAILNSSTETPSDATGFPFANERMTSVISCVVG